MTSSSAAQVGAATCALVAAGCFPQFEDRPWLVHTHQLLAIRATPAEQRPGQPVRYDTLLATPDGTGAQDVSWSYCLEPRNATTRAAASPSCVRGDNVVPITADATLISDACARFGPNPPPPEGNAGQRRPSDPDSSGGFYVPVRSESASAVAIGFQRVRCDLPGATRAIFDEYEEHYTLNVNPVINGVTLAKEGVELGDSPQVEALFPIDIAARVPRSAAEPYIVYRPEHDRLDSVSETLTASFHVTDGQLSASTFVMTPNDETLVARTRWTPTSEGIQTLWLVVRDERRGVQWVDVQVLVKEDR